MNSGAKKVIIIIAALAIAYSIGIRLYIHSKKTHIRDLVSEHGPAGSNISQSSELASNVNWGDIFLKYYRLNNGSLLLFDSYFESDIKFLDIIVKPNTLEQKTYRFKLINEDQMIFKGNFNLDADKVTINNSGSRIGSMEIQIDGNTDQLNLLGRFDLSAYNNLMRALKAFNSNAAENNLSDIVTLEFKATRLAQRPERHDYDFGLEPAFPDSDMILGGPEIRAVSNIQIIDRSFRASTIGEFDEYKGFKFCAANSVDPENSNKKSELLQPFMLKDRKIRFMEYEPCVILLTTLAYDGALISMMAISADCPPIKLFNGRVNAGHSVFLDAKTVRDSGLFNCCGTYRIVVSVDEKQIGYAFIDIRR